MKTQPVKKGDEFEAQCESIGSKGDGIFKKQGFAIIVPDTVQGRAYLIRVTTVMEKFAFGEIVREA